MDDEYPYQPYYCEENVWKLCDARVPGLGDRAAFVVLIRAAGPAFPILAQRLAPPGQPLFWDYHVIYAEAGLVYDRDSALGFPVPAALYLERSFLPEASLREGDRPRFRPVPAREWLASFSSDRSHMRAPDGSWLRPPPPWPPVGKGNALPAFLSLREGSWLGLGAVGELLRGPRE